ncbi:MAG TPA: RIP metalloprotease RseP [Planctomycetota bacterium]|nr:RIP metalloprotease RseP [Planctomycetota bacterium]
MNLASLSLAFMGLDTVGAILAVILGFGVLVFVHELGHFLAAKWVGVRVEVFSLGFGPRLFGFVRGHTDYRVSWLPLGGYVKMLGQDDADPNTPRTQAPDDFRNKSIGGRMLILVAGVVMNAIFALIAFIVAFAVGVEFTAPEVGAVQPNSAASQAVLVGGGPNSHRGLAPGDEIRAINGAPVYAWEDVTTTIALSSGPVLIDIARPDSSGKFVPLTLEATPVKDENGPFPKLGIEVALVIKAFDEDSPAKAAGVQKGDQILDVAPLGSELSVRDVTKFGETIHENGGNPLRIRVQKRAYDQDGLPLESPPQIRDLDVTPLKRAIYDTGITFDQDTVRVNSANGPARSLLEPGDIVVSVDGRAVTATNLPQVVRAAGDAHHAKDATGGAGGTESPHATQKSDPVTLVYERRTKAGKWERKEAQLQLDRRPNDEGWFLGVEYLADKVLKVEDGSPAAKAGIEKDDFVTACWTDSWLWGLKWSGKKRGGAREVDQICQEVQERPWQIGWEKNDGIGGTHTKVIHARKTDRTFGDLGIQWAGREVVLRRGIAGSCSLGANRTIHMFEQLVMTLRGLFQQSVSTKELGGPIQIAAITYKIASSNGLGKLFYFLAILSVNLAVLNILPIPVLDGGHIFLLTLEKLKGRPLSDDVMRYVQYAGLLFVIGLMLYVTFNDIRRFVE